MRVALALIAVILAMFTALAPDTFSARAEALASICTRVVSPGSSLEEEANALKPGEVLCLRGGSYSDPDGMFKLSAAGTAEQGIEVRSYPGEQAQLKSHLWLTEQAHHLTVRGLDMSADFINPDTGSYINTLTVYGDDDRIIDNDITNPETICVLVGANRNGNSPITAHGTLLQGNRVHDCGGDNSDNHKHGVYVSDGADTKIVGNLIHDNADRGVQLYPDAQGTLVKGNVMDGNGEDVNIGGRDGYSPSDTTIENNVITNSRVRWNVESWWGEAQAVGEGNVVRDNCLYASNPDDHYDGGGNGGIVTGTPLGFTTSGNVVANPGFVDRANKDFRLQPYGPCAGILRGANTALR